MPGLGQTEAEALLKRTLKLSKADETQVTLLARDSALTRFANNIIHQNVTESNVSVVINAVIGKRRGTAMTNILTDEALSSAAENALLHARQQPEDPDYPGLADPQSIQPIAAFDDNTATFSPEMRAKAVKIACDLAAERNFNAAGIFSTGLEEMAVANSRGLMVYHTGTFADFQSVVIGPDGSGRARNSSWKATEIDAESIGRESLEKAVRAQNPRRIEPGEYTVVVDPYVTDDLVGLLDFHGMSAETVQEGRSWMNDRIGQQAMSPLVSIWDDSHDLTGLVRLFDFDGVPAQRVSIVDKGTICGPVYDRYAAAKEGKSSTGHALPGNSSMARNLFLGAGTSTVQEMIASTQKGLYITFFWYTRLVHPRDCVVTGMTRDGVYMIENGELTYPVKNLRFTQSYVQALADVEAVGSETRLIADEGYISSATRVPALKINRFNFTGVTV